MSILLPDNKQIEINDAKIKNSNIVESKLLKRDDLNSDEKLNEILEFENDLLAHLAERKLIENRYEFLNAFQTFLNDIPGELTKEISDYYEQLSKIFPPKTDIDSEDEDLTDIDENDPLFKNLERLHAPMAKSLEKYKEYGEKYRQTNKETNNNKTNGEDLCEAFELPGFPEQSKKMQTLFQTLNKYERGEQLDKLLEIVSESLNMPEAIKSKMKIFFQANVNSSAQSDQETTFEASIQQNEYKRTECDEEIIKDLDQLLDELNCIDNKNEQLKLNLKSDCLKIDHCWEECKNWSSKQISEWYAETRQNGYISKLMAFIFKNFKFSLKNIIV